MSEAGVSVQLTLSELGLLREAIDELIYEYEHFGEPPSKRGGTPRNDGPDTAPLRALADRLDALTPE
ncbi:MAG: hypothetical protein ACJ72N_26075 [Labedaea sp.]